MSAPHPALRRGGIGLAAGLTVGGLVVLQTMNAWPPLRSVAVVLTPVPLVVATVRAGWLGAASAFVAATFVLQTAPLGGEVPVWTFVVGYGGIVAYVLLLTRWLHAVNVVVVAGLALATGLALLHLTAGAQEHERTLAAEYQSLAGTLERELAESPTFQQMDSERQAQMLRALPVLRRLLPAMTIGQYASSLAVAAWASLFALRRLRLVQVPRLDFGAWRLPEWAIFCFLLPAVGLLAAVSSGHDTATAVTANALTLVLCVYVVQGYAILHAFLRHLKVHPLVEMTVFVAVLFIMPLLLTVLVAGLFDFHVDFRRRWMPASPAPDERPEA